PQASTTRGSCRSRSSRLGSTTSTAWQTPWGSGGAEPGLAELLAAVLDVRAAARQELCQEDLHGRQALGRRRELRELSLGQPPPPVPAELADELSDLREREAGILGQPHHLELGQKPFVEEPPARGPRRPRQQAFLFVETQCRGRDPGPPDDFSDAH